MASSIYSPLQGEGREFRLLVLESSTDFLSPVRCELNRASFDDGHLRYTALSYTWGDPLATKPIIVNGVETQVTLNLEAALRYIRKSSFDITLWVDALCINQNDVAEKNHQVGMMRDIYAGAELVIAWLGSPSDDSDLAMDLLGEGLEAGMESEGSQHNSIQEEEDKECSVLSDEPSNDAHNGEEGFNAASELGQRTTNLQLQSHTEETVYGEAVAFSGVDNRTEDDFCITEELGNSRASRRSSRSDLTSMDGWSGLDRAIERIKPRAALAVTRLLTRSWWSRIWVVQEVLLANQVVFKCGDAEVAGEQMRSYERSVVITSCLSKLWTYCDSIDHYMSVHNLLADMDAKKRNNDTMDFFFKYSTREATNPHDHIYGLFGIIPKDDQILLGAPDYECGVAELFTNVATKLMLRHTSLDLLKAAAPSPATTGPSTNNHLPSWAPDWTQPVRTGSEIEWEGLTNFSKPEFRFSKDCKELILKCYEIDNIESVKSLPALAQGKMPLWQSALKRENTKTDRGSPPLEGILVALLMCFWGLAHRRLDNRQGFESVAAFLQELEEYRISLGRDKANDFNNKADYLAGLLEWTEEERGGRTDEAILAKIFNVRAAYSFVEWYHRQSKADLRRFYKRYSLFRMFGPKFSMLRTSKGSFSIAYNAEAAAGDILCVVPTCSVPLLFREVQSSKYVLIGPCDAIAGFTHRELAKAAEKGEIVKKLVTLL